MAILDVHGVLFKRPGELACATGATATYESLRREFQAALDDPKVRAVLLDLDSPGGELAGLHELAGAIRAARGRKPIAAFVGDIGASAAYCIASAADKIGSATRR